MKPTSVTPKKPVVLAILDGWGVGRQDSSNAVFLAKKPNLDKLFADYPSTLLNASGLDVGLPEGIMGNSEVGHNNIGAGRVVYQQLVAINLAIKNGDFFKNTQLDAAYQSAKKAGKALHLIGLLSDGGVHSDINHLIALIQKAKDVGIEQVYVHAFMDGRDTAPTSGLGFMTTLINKMNEIGVGQVATVSGRYFAMDRDKNFDRVRVAYDAIVNAKGLTASDPQALLKERYALKEEDEFIKPTCILKEGKPIATIKAGDSVICFNFRPDRSREIVMALLNKIKPEDDKKASFIGTLAPSIYFVSMTQYKEGLNEHVAFPPVPLTNTLGEVVADHGLLQLRIAETEKYAHVTFFFNGGEEVSFSGEARILVDSPREVAGLYDKKPEMSAPEITKKLLTALDHKAYDLVVLNFANMDMVGHTGKMDAAIKAVETVDNCVGQLWVKIKSMGGVMVITADHGNADLMVEPDGSPMTAHTLNQVPLIIAGLTEKVSLRKSGRLADIAPTLLTIMGIPKPAEMTGEDLIV